MNNHFKTYPITNSFITWCMVQYLKWINENEIILLVEILHNLFKACLLKSKHWEKCHCTYYDTPQNVGFLLKHISPQNVLNVYGPFLCTHAVGDFGLASFMKASLSVHARFYQNEEEKHPFSSCLRCPWTGHVWYNGPPSSTYLILFKKSN